MKKNIVLIVLLLSVCFISFKENENPKTPNQRVKDIFISDLKKFIISTHAFYKDAKKYVSDSTTKKQLIIDFKASRIAYKKVEYLAEYYAPSTSKLINGPFLYKTNEEEPSKAPIKPEGFQAIEDQLFAADTIDKYELETLCYRLRQQSDRLYPMVTTYEFTDQNLWLASRMHLLRIMAQGITGFDSPSAKLSIAEAKAGLTSIKKCWQPYIADSTLKDWVETKQLFAKADQYLTKNNDFDAFNRLVFITDFINPLYSKGAALQAAIQIGYLDERTAVKQDATNLFTTQAWDAHYFQSYRKEADPKYIKRASIGKFLFFDPVLSSNGKRSCASCHNPQHGFAETRAKSTAMDGMKTIKRNAPTLLNVALQAKLFADARLNFLEDQIQDVVFAQDELHGNFKEIAQKLKTSQEYKQLFAEAFAGSADSEISPYSIMKCIAEYERTLIGFNSNFDKFMQGDKKALNTSEIRGFNIFSGKGLCATCHFLPLFNGAVPPLYVEGELEVLGVPENPKANPLKLDGDKGRGEVTAIPWQMDAFKTPTVRNIALTAPYMHNGAYQTLEEVVDFYNKGGGNGLGLNLPNQTLPFDNLNLSKQEQKDLVAFMKTLTDTISLTSAPAYLPEIQGFTRKVGGEY